MEYRTFNFYYLYSIPSVTPVGKPFTSEFLARRDAGSI